MSTELELAPSVCLMEAIECSYLDGENVGWTKRYIERCQEKLAAIEADQQYESYLKHEIATHVELLDRFKKPKDQ